MPSVPCFPCNSYFLPEVLEELLDAIRREVTDLQCRLGEVDDQCEALEDGTLAVFHVVEPQAPMRVDQLHALPEIIRSSVRLGIHRGATAALVSVRLDFAGFGRVVAAEMDVDDLL